MQKQEVPDKPVTEEPRGPLWIAPEPPVASGVDRVVFFFERYGFLVAFILTLAILIGLFFNTDLLLRQPETVASRNPAAETATAPAEQDPASQAQPAPEATVPQAADVPPDGQETVALSITTNPASAAVFIDGEFIGISPLREFEILEGVHRISIQRQDYVPVDTVLTLADAPASIQLDLRTAEMDVITEAGDAEAGTVESSGAGATPSNQETRTPPPRPVQTETPREQPSVAAEETALSQESVEETPPRRTEAREEPQVSTRQPAEERPEAETAPAALVGIIDVQSQPSGAEVFLNGSRIGVTPLVLENEPVGTHQVSLRMPGYEAFNTTVTVAPEQRAVVMGRLTQQQGTLKVLAQPWGNIYIDGELHKSEASFRYTTTLSPGDHHIRIEHPALGKWEQVVLIKAGEERSITIDFNDGSTSFQ